MRLRLTQFERAIKQKQIVCDICGKPMISLHGGGWEYDRIVCTDTAYCGAEIVYPTSTVKEDKHGKVDT